jgi:hypothetical protein
MNADRRAALQRKLAVAPVPKPPAGLAARIKNEIPKELRFSAERERARLNQSVRLSVAVAASVIVVIATAYVALDITTRSEVGETAKPAAATATRQIETPRLQVPAAAPPAPQIIPLKQAARARTKKQEERRAEVAPPPASEPAAVSFIPPPEAAAMDKVVQTAAAPAAANAVKEEVTTSPVSGKVMAREGTRVFDTASAKNVKLTAWKDTSRETKIEILKAELARGAEPGEVARVAREAGLDEFAESIEKKQKH